MNTAGIPSFIRTWHKHRDYQWNLTQRAQSSNPPPTHTSIQGRAWHMDEGRKGWVNSIPVLVFFLKISVREFRSVVSSQSSAGRTLFWSLEMKSVYTQTRVSDAGFLLPVNIFQGELSPPPPPSSLLLTAQHRRFKHHFKGETTFRMTGTIYRRLMLGLIVALQTAAHLIITTWVTMNTML